MDLLIDKSILNQQSIFRNYFTVIAGFREDDNPVAFTGEPVQHCQHTLSPDAGTDAIAD
jgi:hypothetical protein